MTFRELTPEEERVIVHKGTEAPFSGEYNDFDEKGYYACRRCGALLYRSESKFKSGCGWPSFDDEIRGAVKRETDADGRRTEILCDTCGAHLGHVFTGERFTAKNTRHCVNSISLQFVSEADVQLGEAVFAGGCFWGVEYWLGRIPGVLETTVGFTGGHEDDPSYQDVCTRQTGHAEAVQVVFDPVRVSYETLARAFFETHDPTQLNRQGPDIGEQYRSAVFYADEEQRSITERLIEELRENGYDVQTELVEKKVFWPAEGYHQDYYDKKGSSPYCHAPVKRFRREDGD